MTSRPTWTVAQAKARFSEVMDLARNEGPQTITRLGKSAFVIVDAAEWTRRTHRNEDLASFLLHSPLHGSGLEVGRLSDTPRAIEL